MAITWDKAAFDQYYVSPCWKFGIRGASSIPSFHYHWYAQKDRLAATIAAFLSLPGAAQISHVAIIGGGFGWTAEILAANGVTAISVDTSPHVVSTQATSEQQELRDALAAFGHDPDNLSATIEFMSPFDPNTPLSEAEVWANWTRVDNLRTSIPVEQEDLSNNGSRRKVRQRLGNNLDGILTEFAMESQGNDQESLTLADRCEQLRPNPSVPVIHLLSGEGSLPGFNFHTYAEWRTLLNANGFSHHVVADAGGNTY